MISRKIFRAKLQRVLRNTGLLAPAEKLRYYFKVVKLRNRNRRFIEDNPGFTLPPPYLAFDAYSSSHWEFYKVSGEITARFLGEIISRYFPPANHITSIYEWGCGPARIIRQLPIVIGREDVSYFASDYNEQTIQWCKSNIEGVNFTSNQLEPPLSYEDDKFDFIYAASVFTHLSEDNAIKWVNELRRVLKPTGILLITTNSDAAYQKELLSDEKRKYESEGIVVSGKYEEGKKMFLARHSPAYIRNKLLASYTILEHVPLGFPFMKQDYWIARKS
jgi:SAM-dependent methyltransferase